MKKILIISSSPNLDGLTAACAQNAELGIEKTDVEYKTISLNHIKIKTCLTCDNAWGICRTTHKCCIKDDFAILQDDIESSDAIVFITPVYWGEMSEPAKSFIDRLRRCEATAGENSRLKDKKIILVAAAGGSGNGTATCLSQMNMAFKHMRADVCDLISITQFSKRYKLSAIKEASFEVSVK